MISRVLRGFLWLLDSETVRLFIWPFYSGILAFGLCAVTIIPRGNSLERIMGSLQYELWAWMNVIATIAVLLGLAIRHGGRPVFEMNRSLLFADWMGLFLQVGGHMSMFWVLLDFEIFTSQIILWWTDVVRIFAFFAVAPYVLGCVFLSMQTMRKIWRGEKLHRVTRSAGGVLQAVIDDKPAQ